MELELGEAKSRETNLRTWDTDTDIWVVLLVWIEWLASIMAFFALEGYS
jgi:hypothetical protein